MGYYIGPCEARAFAEVGEMIGMTSPCRETKGLWWQVYRYGNEYMACCYSDSGIVCGESITAEEIDQFTE